MRVVLLTQYFPPEPTQLYGELAVGLRELGHDVVVVTGFPNWPSGRIYPGYRNRLRQWDEHAGVPVLRLLTFADHSKSRFRRVLNLFSLASSFALLGPWLVRRPSCVHVVQLATLCASARLVGGLWRVPHTLEIQDLWPETLHSTGMVASRRALAVVGRLCDATYRWASAIRVISPGFRENLIGKGVPPSKIEVIENWVDTDFYRPEPPDPALAERLGMAGRFNVLYAGNLGLMQGLGTLLDAAALLRDRPDIQICLAGDGVEREALRRRAESEGLRNVRFLGSFPTSEMNPVYALADALLVHLRRDPLAAITIPHKVQSYLAVGKPIVCALEGDPRAIVEQAAAGLACPPEDPEAMAQAIRRLADLPEADRRAMGARGRAAAQRRFDRTTQIAKVERMIRRTAEG
ncbi:MAG: glycosyltransferase family 4 protein [Fimbriimonadales bacterium]|nr:glycosyltransferase family 4 protein [Fimbriimonadales bacterium]